MAPPIIEVVDVTFSYSGRVFNRNLPNVLSNISFDVNPGETLCVIGRNGSGKSTLLRLLASIYEPSSGRITTQPVEISLLSLQMGFLPELSGRQNCFLSSMLLGKNHAWVTQHIDEIAQFAELTDKLDAAVKTYSSGMRARLGFAIAYVSDPEVILIDEVLGVGDVDFRKKSTAAMHDRLRSNKTIVLVTHNLNSVLDLCDRVVWIEQGELIGIGTPADIVPEYMEYGRGTG